MKNQQIPFTFQVGGSLASYAGSYVSRSADLDLYEGLKAGEFCYVLNSRQMGKSSLRVRTMQKLMKENICCGFIDLTGIGTQEITPEKWYAGIVQALVSTCQLDTFQWQQWWLQKRELFSPLQRLKLFIEDVLLLEITDHIVIFVDEIDRVLSQNFDLDDFFGLIRFCFEARSVNSDYERLTWVLLGVATPSDIIQDKEKNPFNFGRAIRLQGFNLQEVTPLREGLANFLLIKAASKDDFLIIEKNTELAQDIMQEIIYWTGGQPFLTQKLCHIIIQELEKCNFKENNNDQLLNDSLIPAWVEQVVQSRIITNWESADEPEHLRTIRDRLLTDESQIGGLLGLYQQILQNNKVISNGSKLQRNLRLSGIVIEREGKLTVFNPIYRAIFNLNWVDQQFSNLRPYHSELRAWFASNNQDESFLLQGQKLQNALTWSLGKSLSDQDYQFLVASQELANRQVQNTLAITQEASLRLAQIRQKVNLELQKRRLRKIWLPALATLVTLPILILRLSGLLQGLEWNSYDQFFRWRSHLSPDPRIVIVTIDESDLHSVGQWPIPDGVLAQVLTTIKSQKPQAIGLDLYRDLPVEPGHQKLLAVFETTPNLFGIEKVVGNKVSPPPLLSGRQQIGFADQVVDGDGKVRRGLLSVVDTSGKTQYSLAVKLALPYLMAQGIKESQGNSPHSWQLGKAVFRPFAQNDGGYVGAQAGGYQILINFRGNEAQFLTFSLNQVLKKQIPSEVFRDRLILIGATAPSLNDFFATPYSGALFRSPKPMPGVILHANIISQILSAAMDGRALLRTWNEPIENLWIWFWAGIGAFFSWWLKSFWQIILGILGLSVGLVGICYVAFLWGWWIPLIPPLLSLFAGAIVLLLMINKQMEKLRSRRTLALLLDLYGQNPAVGRIALEYQKHSETKAHQILIEEELRKVGVSLLNVS